MRNAHKPQPIDGNTVTREMVAMPDETLDDVYPELRLCRRGGDPDCACPAELIAFAIERAAIVDHDAAFDVSATIPDLKAID